MEDRNREKWCEMDCWIKRKHLSDGSKSIFFYFMWIVEFKKLSNFVAKFLLEVCIHAKKFIQKYFLIIQPYITPVSSIESKQLHTITKTDLIVAGLIWGYVSVDPKHWLRFKSYKMCVLHDVHEHLIASLLQKIYKYYL